MFNITGSIVDLHEKGVIAKLLDTQSFDSAATASLARNPNYSDTPTGSGRPS